MHITQELSIVVHGVPVTASASPSKIVVTWESNRPITLNITLRRHNWLKSFLAASMQFTNHIYHKRFSRQNSNQSDIGTLAVAYLSLLFIYLFIYLLLNASHRESSLSGYGIVEFNVPLDRV